MDMIFRWALYIGPFVTSGCQASKKQVTLRQYQMFIEETEQNSHHFLHHVDQYFEPNLSAKYI